MSNDFFPLLLAGMAVNFEIAGMAIALGLIVGALLSLIQLYGGPAQPVATLAIALMRAAPTFVVMFFLLNALPREAGLTGAMIVGLSLVPYAAAYTADSGVDAFRQIQRGSPLAGALFLPNTARAFFVLVMSSSAGAAIGVNEGIAVIVRQSETLPSLADRLALFAIGITCFGVPLQACFALIRLIERRLSRIGMRRGLSPKGG